jgi:hypothetical protein
MRASRCAGVGLVCALASACDRSPEASGTGTATATPGNSVPSGPAFSGTYRSAWGTTVFSQEGSRVTATYPNGTVTCIASGASLACDWREAAASGKAKLAKMPNGDILGSWGNGASATDGGPWSFVLESGTASDATGPVEKFAGSYRSNWGLTVFEQEGRRVTAKYATGTLSCAAAGNTLDCDWRDGDGSGKAQLVKQQNGVVSGTWGNGASATDGGPWVFTPQ